MRLTSAAMALALGLLGWEAQAEPQPLKVVSETTQAEPGSHFFVLHSDRLGREFQVRVDTPKAVPFLPGQKFPAVYALDGGYGLAGPEGVLLASAGAMAPAIIISVGYGPGQEAFRNTDLLYNKLVTPRFGTIGGGGAVFAAFLLEDLRPFIEGRFPADHDRSVLFGHSFGGLFAAHVFADNPNAFYGYIIGSPSVSSDRPIIKLMTEATAQAHDERVYLAVGELEDSGSLPGTKMVGEYRELAAALQERPQILLKTKMYPGETHLSYYPRLITDGLPFMLPPAIPLGASIVSPPPEVTNHDLGVYDLPDGRKITITREASYPMSAKVSGGPTMTLLPNGENRYYAYYADLNFTFDGSGATLTGGDGGNLRIVREKTP